MGRFLSIRLKDPQPLSFMVHPLGFSEVPDIFSWSAGPQVICPFLHHWVADGTYLLSFFVFMGMLPWAVSIPTSLLLHIPGSQVFGNPQVSRFIFLSKFPRNLFSYGLGWASFFLYFIRPKAYPFMGLGPFLLILVVLNWRIWTLPLPWKHKWFLNFNFVFLWTLLQCCDILDLNNKIHNKFITSNI